MKTSALMGAISSVFLAGCLTSSPVDVGLADHGAARSLGTLAVTSPRFGDVTLSPTTCKAGGKQFFLGGDFADENAGLTMRLVVDPLGNPAARLFAVAEPFDKSVVFHRSDCRAFHFSVDSTGWRVNDVDDYVITLDLDCASPAGDSVKGKLSAAHCH